MENNTNMQKRIAIVTGASGGIGKEFSKLLLLEQIDEIWAIARNLEKLNQLRTELGERIIPISKDLTQIDEIRSIGTILEQEQPIISYLVNNAGVARMSSCIDFEIEELTNTIALNCNALVVLCSLCIPYMQKGSRIINLSSAASFQPLPYLSLYSATKVFERYYSRALNVELKNKGITSIAVCPSWVDTDLLSTEINGEKVKFKGLVSAEKVARKAIKDAKKGKDMSVCNLTVKYEHSLTKTFPQKLSMKAWMRRIKEYIE